MEKVYTWHCLANLSKMERQRSTRCAASLYPGNALLLDDKVLAGKARTRLAAVSRSQHSLHGDISEVTEMYEDAVQCKCTIQCD